MSEVLVSGTVYGSLAQTRQWIDYDPDAMEAMASALDAPLPADEDPIYVIRDKDIGKTIIPGNLYATSIEKVTYTPVYHQGPEKKEASWVVPNRKIFAVMLENTPFDNSDLSAATAERLALPRRYRRDVAAALFGGAIILGSFELSYYDAIEPWLAITAGISGFGLIIWRGPKQRLPDANDIMPPLFLRATQ